MTIFLAQNLYEEKLVGDEPEPLDLEKWLLEDYQDLLSEPTFNEARSIAALMLVKDYLRDDL